MPPLDLQREPLALNERWQVTADGVQWIVQKHRKDSAGHGAWKSVIFCQTKAGLLANIGFEVFWGRGSRFTCRPHAGIGAAEDRRHAPGYTGVDVEAEIARAKAQDRREAKEWLRKTGGAQQRAA
jgi:hypothetical protein